MSVIGIKSTALLVGARTKPMCVGYRRPAVVLIALAGWKRAAVWIVASVPRLRGAPLGRSKTPRTSTDPVNALPSSRPTRVRLEPVRGAGDGRGRATNF